MMAGANRLDPAISIPSILSGVASGSAGGFLLGKYLVAGHEGGLGALDRLSIGLETSGALVAGF